MNEAVGVRRHVCSASSGLISPAISAYIVRSGTVQLRKFEYCQCILVVWWTNMTSSSLALQNYHVKKTLTFLNLIDELYIY